MVRQPIDGLSILNRHPSLLPGPSLLHELVHPSPGAASVAIDFLEDGSSTKISYESLHVLSDAVARRIIRTLAGLGHASGIIPIFLPQCPELYIAILAILKAGKAFCPLGLDTPPERLKFILKDLSANLVITKSVHNSDVLRGLNVQPLLVDRNAPVSERCLSPCIPCVETGDMAYVLYTSGSTGLPKAVSVSHRAATQSLLAHDRHIPRFDRFLQFAAPTFDVSIFEIFFPLFRGKTIVGCSRPHMLNDLPSVIRDLQVDAAELTPTVVSNLIQTRDNVPELKLLLTIGEMLTRHVVDEFGGSSSVESILWGMYGPTEVAIHCTLQPSFQATSSVGNIGSPLDSVSAFIMRPVSEDNPPTTLEILPIGNVGELVLGGYQVADGYLNRPDLTAAAFVQHQEYGLLYRTGDKARLLPDGSLECLGRIESGQVKLRGQRVELGEIEQAISRIDGCRTVAALPIRDTLVAFCAVRSGVLTKEAIMEGCERWLPSHMVPGDVVLLPHMPHLPSGKTDKKALESQYLHQQQSEAVAMPHLNSPIHQVLRQVLGRDVPSNPKLDALAMDSLRSIQVASKLRQQGYNLGAIDVLSASDLQELLSLCETRRFHGVPEDPVEFQDLRDDILRVAELTPCKDAIEAVTPCTPLQTAMLAETMIRPDAYCNWIEVEIPVPRTFEEIRAHIQRLAMDNEILRSGFSATSSGTASFAQIIWKQVDRLQIINVASFSKKFSLGSSESLLQPFRVQVNAPLARPRIVFQIHHALYDGWSFDILLRDLGVLLSGDPVEPRPQYSEVVKFYLRTSYGDDRRVSLSFWSTILNNYHPVRLPNFNGKIVHAGPLRSFSQQSSIRTCALLERAEEFSIHPQVFFQAAVLRMMSFFLGTTDVVIGTVTSGRTIPLTGIEQIVGPCIASLPLRLDLSNCATTTDMLRHIQKSNRDMLQHCTVPLRDIVKSCGLQPGTALFEILFVWQESVFSNNAESALKIIDQADELEYKLTLEFQPLDGHVLVKATYDPSTFPEAQIERLLDQIDEVVVYLTRNINGTVDDNMHCFSLQNLSVANPLPIMKTFHRGPAYTVERWALEAPEKESLIFGAKENGLMIARESITYFDLNARANRLAHFLRAQGVGGDELVCVLMEKSVDLYVSILAVLKLGCGYLPIVPDSPPERTRKILADAQVRICISESSAAAHMRSQVACVVLDVDLIDLSTFSDKNLDTRYNGSHLAYAVFTSGSTGTPKGVLVTQDNLMSNLDYLYGVYPTAERSRLLQACSQAFDVSVFEIFFAWYAGMCLCTATKNDLFSDLEDAINKLEITHLSLTPTVAALINPDHVPTVQFLVTAGEAVTEHVRRQWAGRGLYQGYGPSETTNICTVRSAVSQDDLINNIGPPFDNTSAFVLDPGSECILPRGAVGELCFGGAQVFRGYLNMPDLNMRKIISHPKYGRIYRSGDMGMLLADDCILFTGRSDDQVKIRGQRVELSEITSHILDNSAVQDCVTLLFQMNESNERLVAFWVPTNANTNAFTPLETEEVTLLAADIFESLASNLPSYMLPTHLVPITRIPLTPQSKTDKRLLLSTYRELSPSFLERVAYNTSTEDESKAFSEKEYKIAEALAGTINVPLTDISRTSSFFSLGLDSISAIRFARKLSEAGIGTLLISDILRNANVARLAAACESNPKRNAASENHPNRPTPLIPPSLRSSLESECKLRNLQVQKIWPCTPLQEAMLSRTFETEDLFYFNTMVFNVNGDLHRLQKCWTEMFKRHEILRTAFLPTDNAKFAFAQLVLNFEEVDFEEIGQDQDIKTFASRSLPALLKSSKPPVRLAVRRNSGAKQLIFCCHHALYDGVAIRTLLREIEDAYNERPLRHSISYERYLTHMASQDLIAADRFWGASLAGLEPTYFPRLTGRNPGSDMVTSLSTSTRALGLTLSHISRFCQATSVTLLPVLQATWAKILHFYCGEEDLCFGNVVSGRTLPEAELDRLVGPCFNTIPVRVEFDFKKSSAELIKQLHVFNIASLEYQLTPLRRINAQVQQGKRSLFDTLLILQQPTVPLDGAIWTINEDTGIMDLPLVCEIVQDNTADELRVTLHYYKSLMSNSDAKLVLETFDCALQSLVLYPGSPARDTVGFSRKILAACNLDPTLLKPKEGPVLHSAFEQNASCRPDHTALLFQHASGMRTVWNFRELNENANQIAHALIERGIGPEDIVPVHIAKSPKFYASILGVLKAGAAFTPVAPDLPPARKAYMVSDLNPKLVLCADHTTMDWCNSVPVLSVNLTNQYARENPIVHGLAPTNLVYCIYTSGSTGVPKAVSMEHGAPIQTIEASRSRIPWRHESRLLQYAATTFDMCYYDCFLAWSYGFTLCTAEQSEMLNDLVGVIRSLKVDLLDLTPSVAATVTKAQVPSVRWLYCIGEAMSSEVVKEWGSLCVNSYGPTEAAFCTTISEVQEDSSANIIGRPFSTTTFTVFPRSGGRVLPVFGVGELYIGGSQLARGYHNRPDLDEDRFTTRNGARWYKSGDIVRMLGDGNFEFIGRVDDQIKIRGLRVELGEINHVIQASDDRIRSVTTQILRKDLASKYQLVSFLETGRQDNEEALAKIRSRAKQAAMEHLPAYMVPRFYVFVASIPKSSAGKIDKNALTTIFCTSGFETRGNNRDHHWTRTETQVREVLAKVSGTPIDEIHPTTSIYHLGLDSVSAVQVATALRKSGLSVSVTDVLKYTNCVDIGTHVDQSSRTDMPKATLFDFESFDRKFRSEISQRIRIRAEDIEAISPCTPLQSGMISQTIAKEGSVYFNYVRLRLNPGIDLRRLCRAWRMAMEAHQILRTGFVHVADNTYPFAMVRYTNAACSISWEDNTDEDKISSEEWLTNIQCNAPGNLHRPPWYIRTVVSKFDSKCIDMAIFHALYDAQSLAAIFDDVSKAYDQSLIQPSYPIEPVLSRILSLSDNQDAEIGAFWEKQKQIYALNRFPNLAPLRLEPLPPAVVSKVCNISISKLEAGCRDANITLQAAGIASWVSILSAYTGEESATCGVVLSGRNFEGAESAVFPCITTVPFVCTVSGDDKKLLEDVMLLGAELQHHQFTPLNRIQRLMGYPTESLFDSLFTFQKMPNSGREHNLWTVVDEKATVEYPLSIELEPKDGKLEMRLTYLPHIVPTAQAELILDQIDHVMNRFIFPKVENLSEVHDHNKLYSITPPKEPAISSEVTLLHEFVAMSAAKSPDSIALEFATSVTDSGCTSTTWTYAELDTQGNKIANMLISHGTPQGSLVGICFDKCPEAYFAILGILKAGCAFVALDPGAPSARQAFIVKDSGVKIVLSKKSQTKELHGIINATLMSLDDMDLGSMSPAKPALVQAIDPGDRSYCLYTSGTTGIPKGCELTHENAVQALLSFQRLFTGHWDVQSRWLQFASFHFDVSVLEQYWSWSVGIRLVSAPRDVIFEDLARTINVLGVTHIDLTPSLARLLHPDDVPSLCRGVFITGGESLKEEILDVWGPKGVIYNGYGPTEATIGVTMYPRVPANGKPSNIGPQFDNVGSFVLKPGSDIPVLRGGVGELCVSGKLVGKGYLNRPQLTDERFPHLARFNERVYRTGDLVRILCDGTFDILGRADDQVKLRGQRLEIGEINSVIKQSTLDFSDVATLVLRHPKQQKEQLVSFIATGTSSRDEPRILIETATSYVETARRSCRERLPGYMVPTHFVVLSAMPLSANNKADHRKLKDMYSALSMPEVQLLSGPSNSNDGLWSNDERKIGKVLQDMLQTSADDIKRTSSVFELGLDSISVIGFCRSLKQAGFPNATASVVMKNSSIEQLCKALSGNRSETHGSSSLLATQQTIAAVQHRHRHTVARSLSLNSQDIESLAPCTPLQQGMIARSLEAEQRLYFNSVYFDILGAVDEDKLRAAWGEAFDCIQILRTVFVNTEEGYVQAVLRNSSLPWNACTLPTNQRLDEGLKRLKSQWCQSNQMTLTRPFELHLVTSTERKVLAVHIFHALYDGISIGLLFKAIWDMFNGHWERNAGTTFHSVLPYGPLLSVGGAREFWKTHFSEHDARPLFLAADDSKSGVVTLDRQINPKGYESVRRRLNVTPQAMAQACWATVLYNYVQGPVTIGMVVSGRSIDLDGAENTIGPMFNTLPYQHKLRPQESWTSIVKRTHDFNVAVHAYQHTPLRDIMKWTKRNPGLPLFDNLFVYQAAEQDQSWAKNDVWVLRAGDADADYPVALEVEQGIGGILKVTLVAQNRFLNEESAMRLLNCFEDALRTVVTNPDEVVSSVFQEMGDNTRKTGLSESNGDPTATDGAYDDLKHFQWTPAARAIKEELVRLAGAQDTDINEATSIFELGLDSIDAIKLSSKLKKRGVDLPVSGIMRGLTIVKMVTTISGAGPTAIEQSTETAYESHIKKLEDLLHRNGLRAIDAERILPLTPLQEGMVAEMLSSGFTRYYNHDVLELAPHVDLDILQRSLMTVVGSSPILRTSFVEIDDPAIDFTFAQVVHRTPHKFLRYLKVDSKPDFQEIFTTLRENAIKAKLMTPLFNITIIDSPGMVSLVLSIAHALYDGWSLTLLHSDILKAYQDQFKPRPDFEPVLKEILTATGSEAATFWQDFLSGSEPSLFRRRLTANAEVHHQIYRMERTSDLNLTDLTSFAKKNKVTLEALGQTVYAITLASYIHSLDVTFGSVFSGRDDENMAEILFPTMNTVAVRTVLHGTRRVMLQYVQETLGNIKQFQHFPLRKSKALSGVQRSLFESLFIFQKAPDAAEAATGTLYRSVYGLSDVEYPVCVELEVFNGIFTWRCALNSEVFDRAGAQGFLTTLDSVLKAVVQEPDAPTILFTSAGASVCGLPPFQTDKVARVDIAIEAVSPSLSAETGASATLKTIREVLAVVSGIPEEQITGDMTIFHIGLDSISAIKVSSLLRKRSITINVGEMLKAGSLENIANIIDQRKPKSEEGPSVSDTASILAAALGEVDQGGILREAGLEGGDVERLLPVTAGQMYMLSMWLNSDGTLFYPDFHYQVTGNMSLKLLQRAWQALVGANPILRTCVLPASATPFHWIQAILKNVKGFVTDVTGQDERSIIEVTRVCARKQPYAHLFVSRTQTGWNLRLQIHHVLYDGVSLPLLIRQYQDLCNGAESPPLSHETFSTFIAGSVTPSALEKRRTFWSGYLGGLAPVLRRLAQPISSPASRTEFFRPALIQDMTRLEGVARKYGISTQAIFLATYARLYASLTAADKNQDVVVGIYLANRSHQTIPKIADSTVPTVNLVPLRVCKPWQEDILEVARQIQDDIQAISTPENASVSLLEVAEWTGVRVDTFVNFLKLPGADVDMEEMEHGSSSAAQEEKHGSGIASAKSKITITQTGDKWTKDISRVAELRHVFDIAEGEETKAVPLVDKRVTSAYLHAVDIEATIRDGRLDVGVFAPVEMLGVQGAEDLIGNWKKGLEGVVEEVE